LGFDVRRRLRVDSGEVVMGLEVIGAVAVAIIATILLIRRFGKKNR
jgi:hypothetical protein